MEIVNYIRSERFKSITNDNIREQLRLVGWSNEDIENAFKNVNNDIPVSEDNIPRPPVSKSASGSMWDAFQHVLMFISLYVFASSVALILHFFVDKYFPNSDVSGYGYQISYISGTLLYGYLSALIVSFPLWAFFFLRITNQTMKNSRIRQLSSRKLLIYLTLIGTFIIMMVKVISTVFSLLNGNIGFNFILHFIITAGVAALIFVYYLNEVKEDRKYV